MNILYISPENTVGTLSLWEKAHEAKGNKCTFITLYPAWGEYDSGICLNLPLVASDKWYREWRHKYYKKVRGGSGDYEERAGFPPTWTPNSGLEKLYFQFRDWVWHFKIEPAIENYNLMDFDIVHLEWGLEFYRDGRFAKKLSEAGIPIVCTYHGQDLRTRGVVPVIDGCSNLNLTSELDLLGKHPDINYLFLPFDTSQFESKFELGNPIRICHAPTDRYYKGSDSIIPVCRRLEEEEGIEFVLLENLPNDEVLYEKQSCDILIDQVHNRGGWGYGMNSVEALSMGLCCVTELVPDYVDFIPDHPFVNVTAESLYSELKKLLKHPELILEHKTKGRDWVVEKHDYRQTVDVLYNYYNEKGWLL
jgi:hypothetical protein|tara:strand:- start:2166 stop:3254 length:1089 start_codon:yes stop_codon:yes gene_type:complete